MTQNIELSLQIVFVARLQGNRLHRKLNLIVVLLLDELDDAEFARAERVTCIIQVLDLLCFQYTGQARQWLHLAAHVVDLVEHVLPAVLERVELR